MQSYTYTHIYIHILSHDPKYLSKKKVVILHGSPFPIYKNMVFQTSKSPENAEVMHISPRAAAVCGPTLVHPKKTWERLLRPRGPGVKLERQMGEGFSCFKSEVLTVDVDLSLSGNRIKH